MIGEFSLAIYDKYYIMFFFSYVPGDTINEKLPLLSRKSISKYYFLTKYFDWLCSREIHINIANYVDFKINVLVLIHCFNCKTLSGHIGKVVALHAEGWKGARSNPGCGWSSPIYTIQTRGAQPTHEGGLSDQSIWSTASDAIVCSWLWLTATRSSPLGYFCRLQQIVDNWPHILW